VSSLSLDSCAMHGMMLIHAEKKNKNRYIEAWQFIPKIRGYS